MISEKMAGLPLPPPVTMSDSATSVIRPFMINQAPAIDEAWSNAAIEFRRKREGASQLYGPCLRKDFPTKETVECKRGRRNSSSSWANYRRRQSRRSLQGST